MSRREPPVVWLDCDPGHDDAAAIVLASRTTQLIGISTVSGNAPLERTTQNALLVCQMFGIDVPVFVGAAGPMHGDAVHAPAIHGISGLDGPDRPALSRTVDDEPAVESIIRASREHPSLWIVATGPLTNVATALLADRTLAGRVAGISLMGGSATIGNWTPAAEFNIWADPEAADVVFSSGAQLRMVGLDATHQVLVQQRHADELRAAGTIGSVFMAELYEYFRATYRDAFGMDAAPLHDPCAVAMVTHPELFDLTPRHVAIETVGRHTRGMTVVDARGHSGRSGGATPGVLPNAAVAHHPDAAAILALVRDAVCASAGVP